MPVFDLMIVLLIVGSLLAAVLEPPSHRPFDQEVDVERVGES